MTDPALSFPRRQESIVFIIVNIYYSGNSFLTSI